MAAIAGFAFVVNANYPGYLNYDILSQLFQLRAGDYADWQPPFIVLLWMGAMKVFPGPSGLLVLENLLIWGGLASIALGLRRRMGAWCLLILVIPFIPGVFNFLGNTNRDTLMMAWTLAAFSAAFCANDAHIAGRKRLALQMLASVFAVAAFLVRTNAIFALMPLLLYIWFPLGWRRNMLVCLVISAAMPLTQIALNRMMDARHDYPEDSIKTFHLLALSYLEGKNLFPGVWTEEESRQIAEACYSPRHWDTAGIWAQQENCGMIHAKLLEQGLWGSAAMTRSWLTALARNPVGAYAAMAETFHKSMHQPYEAIVIFNPGKFEDRDWMVLPPYRETTQIAHKYLYSRFILKWSKSWIHAAMLTGVVILLLALRLAEKRLGLFALALACSGLIYLLSYFPFTVAALYRYFYWSGVAAWLSALLLVIAACARFRMTIGRIGTRALQLVIAWRATKEEEEKRALPRLLRLGVCATVAATVALVSTSSNLPQERRTLSFSALGNGAVTITGLRVAMTMEGIPPFHWVGKPVSIEGWQRVDAGWQAVDSTSPLVTTVKMLHQPVRVVFQTGPDGGKVRIEDNGTVTLVDTRAAEQGKTIVDLPPQRIWNKEKRQRTWHAPARAALVFIALTALLYCFSGRRERPTTDVEAGGNLQGQPESLFEANENPCHPRAWSHEMTAFPVFLSVVYVVRNQGERLGGILRQASTFLSALANDHELIVVDNASDDDSVAVLKNLTGENGLPNLQVYALTGEVDADTAFWAGMENALGDFVAALDPLSDDIAFMAEMLGRTMEGADVVFAHNRQEPAQGLAYRAAAGVFNGLYKFCNGIHLQREAPSYRLLSKRVIHFILQHPQPAIAYRHLPATAGFARAKLDYNAAPSAESVPGKNLAGSIDRGLRLRVSTTRGPLRLVTLFSLFGAAANLLYSVYVLAIALFRHDVTPGWVSLSLQQSGMFLLISLVLLVLGEYILHMASRSNEGPLYHVGQEFTSARITRREKLNIEETR
ncbi:MAG: glycosyltransferase [Zoogloeaceae bacterium]|nr:glycosyltransferase [Zoogloeaceae bacterium]